MLEQIADADLPTNLDELTKASLEECLVQTEPAGAAEIEEFADCYARALCSSELVTPVWGDDIEACADEARASFDFGD